MLRFLVLTSLAAVVLAEPQPRFLKDGSERFGPGYYHMCRILDCHTLGCDCCSLHRQVSLQYNKDGSFYHFCGGTLIRKGWVMTAAQCVYSHNSFRVVLGDLVLNWSDGTEQYRDVARFYVHPEWNFNSISSGHDIALLRLSSEVTLTSYVKLVSLPPLGEILPHNSPCYITGYGSTSTDGSMVSRMRQAYLLTVDHETCTSSGWWGSTVKTTMICAGGGAASGCNGDFGGPLSCKVNNGWYVHGVASFVSGMGCNTPQKPTVFTRVSAYITWMNSVMDNP